MKSPAATPEKGVKETEVNVQEEIWTFIAATLKQGLRRLLEGLLEDEVTAKVNARKYERSTSRQGYRDGHYLRDLVTRYGLMEGLGVPRMTEGPMDFQLFDKYERRRPDVDAGAAWNQARHGRADRAWLPRVFRQDQRGDRRRLPDQAGRLG